MERLTYRSAFGDYGSTKDFKTDRDEVMALRNALGKYEDDAEAAEDNESEWIDSGVAGFKRCAKCKSLWSNDIASNVFARFCPRCGRHLKGSV